MDLLGLHRGKSEGKASGDNTLALPKETGTRRASGDNLLAFPKLQREGQMVTTSSYFQREGQGEDGQ